MHKLLLGILFFIMTPSFANDATAVNPQQVHPMRQVSKINADKIDYQPIQYTDSGDQIVPKCPEDTTLVHIENAAKQVYWGPPSSICTQYGDCSGFGCYCKGSPHNCCAWCPPPCISYTQVKWQGRPLRNQTEAIRENMPSVLSKAGCAPIETTWEPVG